MPLIPAPLLEGLVPTGDGGHAKEAAWVSCCGLSWDVASWGAGARRATARRWRTGRASSGAPEKPDACGTTPKHKASLKPKRILDDA